MAEHSSQAATRTRRSAIGLLVALLAAALTVAACGGDDNASSGGGGGSGSTSAQAAKPATLNVGVIPIADVAPLYLGINKGFFKEQNLTIKPKLAEGGAAITPAVLSGDFQVGFSNNISLLIAASKGLPVQVVTQGVVGGKDESKPWADLLVEKNGPIKTAKDLEGKTIAVNTLKNICEVTIKASLAKKGVDVNTLKFIEVPFPDMNAALDAKRVDGACVVEPFVSQGKAGKARGVDPFYVGTAPDLSIASYFVSRQYAEQNKDVVDRFATAMNKSLDYAQAHPDETRAVLTTYTPIPKAAAEKIQLPVWSSHLNPDSIALLSKLSKQYGLIDKEPDLGTLVRSEG